MGRRVPRRRPEGGRRSPRRGPRRPSRSRSTRSAGARSWPTRPGTAATTRAGAGPRPASPSRGWSATSRTSRTRPCTRSSAGACQDRETVGFDFATEFEVESYLHHQGEAFTQRFDANSYLYITKAIDYFDLSVDGSLAAGLARSRGEGARGRRLVGLALPAVPVAGPRRGPGRERGRGRVLRDRVQVRPRRLPPRERPAQLPGRPLPLADRGPGRHDHGRPDARGRCRPRDGGLGHDRARRQPPARPRPRRRARRDRHLVGHRQGRRLRHRRAWTRS